MTSYLSDRYRKRALLTSISSIVGLVGFIVFLRTSIPLPFPLLSAYPSHHIPSNTTGSTSKHVAYGSLFLSVSGVYALAPLLAAWMANNSEPHYRRATSVALGFVATNAVRPPIPFSSFFPKMLTLA